MGEYSFLPLSWEIPNCCCIERYITAQRDRFALSAALGS
jgi:hypothetical protein